MGQSIASEGFESCSYKSFESMEISILEARDLRPMDLTGSSDPYCVVKIGGKKIGQTSTKHQTCEPEWNETISINGNVFKEIEDKNLRSVAYEWLEFEVQDWDAMKSDDRIGICRLPLLISPEIGWKAEQAESGEWKVYFEGWMQLYNMKSEPEGEIRVRAEFMGVSSDLTASKLSALQEFLSSDDYLPYARFLYLSPDATGFVPPADINENVHEVVEGIEIEVPSRHHQMTGTVVLTDLRLLFLPKANNNIEIMRSQTMQIYLGSVLKVKPLTHEDASILGFTIQQKDYNKVVFKFSTDICVPKQTQDLRKHIAERIMTEIEWQMTENQFARKLMSTQCNLCSTEQNKTETPLESNAESTEIIAPASALNISTESISSHLTEEHDAESKTSSLKAKNDGGNGYEDILQRDFQRLGIPNSKWRITSLNEQHEFSPTYPSVLVIPENASDELLTNLAAHRSKERIPALVWLDNKTGAALCRSSQPIRKHGEEGDSEVLRLIRANLNTEGTKKIHVFDARPYLNATANAAAGKGFEKIERLGHKADAELHFLDIQNIHVMRNSLHALVKAGAESSGGFYSKLSESGWMEHLSQILKGGLSVVEAIVAGDAVLVHCSDGWDRTTQLTCLSQLLLDPYYRTINGFQVLISKEWFCMGHKFKDRLHKKDELSPVFLQFIEVVWQLLNQFPENFEFTEHYLMTMVDMMYSDCFLEPCTNFDGERRSLPFIKLFDYLDHLFGQGHDGLFLNPHYSQRDTNAVLYPFCDAQHLSFWRRQHMKHSFLTKRNMAFQTFSTSQDISQEV